MGYYYPLRGLYIFFLDVDYDYILCWWFEIEWVNIFLVVFQLFECVLSLLDMWFVILILII